jgi:hypothetical protein
MDNHNAPLDHAAAAHSEAAGPASNAIDFHSVMVLNGCTNGAKLDIDTSIRENGAPGKGGAELVAVNEHVKVTENGRTMPEHVLNNLTLSEHGKNVNLNDRTFVHVDGDSSGKAKMTRKTGQESEKAADQNEAKEKTAKSYALPHIEIVDHAKH